MGYNTDYPHSSLNYKPPANMSGVSHPLRENYAWQEFPNFLLV